MKMMMGAALILAAESSRASSLADLLGHGEDAGQAEFCKDAATPPTPKCAKTPSVDFDAKGRSWFAWVFQGRIYAQSSADGGKTMSKPVAVNREPENILSNGENRPKIRIGGKGQIYVTWSRGLEKAFSADVRFSRSVDDGKTFSEALTINDNRQIIGHSFDSLAVGRDGRVFIAWLDERDAEAAKNKPGGYAGSALYYTWSADEGLHFAPNSKAADHACECCRVQTALDIDGMPVLAWRNIYPENVRDHALLKLDDWNQPGPVRRASHENWHIEGCPHHGPGLAVAEGGRYHLAWYSQSPDATGLFYAYSDDGGAGFSPALAFGNPKANPRHPHVLSHAKEVYLVWLEFDGQQNWLAAMRSADAGLTWSAPARLAESASDMDSPFLHRHGDKIYVSFTTKADGLRLIPLSRAGFAASAVKASAGRSSLKPVPTGFSSRQGTTIALRAARAVLRPPRNDTSLRSHRPMATTMTLRRSLHLAGSLREPARCLGYAGAWKTSRHRQ